MIDLLNELSRNQWTLIFLVVAVTSTIVWIVTFLRLDDGDSGGLLSLFLSSVSLGFVCGLIPIGLIWGIGWTADFAHWMWTH